MKKESGQVKDPVCEMMVDQHENEITYIDMHFAFCSLQCKERFLANPHLYIGAPGIKAPKQEGRVVIKRRRMRLDSALPEEAARIVKGALCELMGIETVSIDGDSIEITYDLLQALPNRSRPSWVISVLN